MKKRLSALLLFLSLAARVFGQQDPMYSQYIFNGLLINPAYAGTRELFNATFLYRNQWVNIPGAPVTGVFSIDSPIESQKVGLGAKVIADKIGITSHTGLSGIYSYKIYFPKSALSFGLEAGVGFYNSNLSEVDYSQNSQNDPAFQGNSHSILPNFNFGTYYHTDRFYAGLSVTDILGRTIQNKINPNMVTDVGIHIVSHLFLTSGYLFDLSPGIGFQPSFLLKYVGGAPLEGDINAVLLLHDLIALGVSWRSSASVNFMTEIRINKNLKLGYSYEYSTNELSNFTSGSHEIVLRYQFANTKRQFVSPRYY
jgi:type IX secretion system PorP/SprF family membrane protein